MPRSIICPEFRLDLTVPRDEVIKNVLFTKRTYSLPVKVEDWDQFRDTLPFDEDPYCPGSINLFKSHYKHLGFDEQPPYITETMDMLSQRYKPSRFTPSNRKHMMTYMSYKDLLPCGSHNEFCLSTTFNDYGTTMQTSYTPPFPYAMERLSTPKLPHLKNRIFKYDNPEFSEHTFYDEGFHEKSQELQRIKSDRSRSYNFCKGVYSDGKELAVKRTRCYPLEYGET
ncbi:uncharacterized protein [Onthophagus taurus]|uniref:uncharacterized protein n=1 Tax=Onthophagus taurus TaxID=166361 RepID=UPI000C209737|nr:uncharacterized protein LOC111428038 [Onthophagus taurus]